MSMIMYTVRSLLGDPGLYPGEASYGSIFRSFIQKWSSFCPQVKGQTPTFLGPLEGANLNH
jgi:hypothetical protein